jgi:large conductance mechanosensitive channel
MRSNVLDLAVAVIIGGVFGKIVSSLVNDIIMPPIGLALGKVDFSNLFINLSGTVFKNLAEAQAAGVPTIRYGIFLNTMIDFLIVGFVIFMIVRLVNKLHKAQPEAPAATRECPYCLSMIPMKATRCGHCTSQLEAKTIN